MHFRLRARHQPLSETRSMLYMSRRLHQCQNRGHSIYFEMRLPPWARYSRANVHESLACMHAIMLATRRVRQTRPRVRKITAPQSSNRRQRSRSHSLGGARRISSGCFQWNLTSLALLVRIDCAGDEQRRSSRHRLVTRATETVAHGVKRGCRWHPHAG